MARNLYRLYLYIIFIALIIFAVVVTAQLLNTLFEFTTLRGPFSSVPTRNELVQSLVFAVIGWLISGALGGLHYWLIRRDLNSHPAAGGSAIRSFFLNMTEAVGILIVVPVIGFVIIGKWAYNSSSDISYPIGIALPILLMVGLLELERRRTEARKGAALVFQRLHFFGVQLILLFFLTGVFISEFRPLIDILFFGGRGLCIDNYCQSYQVAGLAVTLLWFSACWLFYSLLTSRDVSRIVRLIMHGISLAFGISWMLYGIFVAFQALLSPPFHIPVGFNDVLGSYAAYDFVSPLAMGILSTAIYHLLLLDISRRGLIERSTLLLSEGAIAAILLAGTFWWACGSLLYNLLQALAPSPGAPDNHSWVIALALLITGLSYIPLDLLIRRGFERNPANAIGPRRSLVLALLGAGMLALAIGGVVALYAWGTDLLGSPLSNWPQIAHSGLAATVVGAALIAIYVWPVRGEHLLTRQNKTDLPPTPEVPPEPTTIEDILNELLAGSINREEAAIRIRARYGLTTLLIA